MTSPHLLSNHGRLILAIAAEPGLSHADYADRIGTSRRSIIRLIEDLKTARHLTSTRRYRSVEIELHNDSITASGETLGAWIKRQTQ